MARKILTIGITINLENYENLRLEVQGEIGGDGDTEGLITFLDGMLARLGHGDEATAELVDSYRRRVLAMPGTVAPPSVTMTRSSARREGEAPVPRQAPIAQSSATGIGEPATEALQKPSEPHQPAVVSPEGQSPPEEKPAIVRVSPDPKAAKPAARPETAAPPAQASGQRKGTAPQPAVEVPKEPAPKAGKPKIPEGEVACEGCGAAITRNQEKLSKLLTGKSLCKRCMNP